MRVKYFLQRQHRSDQPNNQAFIFPRGLLKIYLALKLI